MVDRKNIEAEVVAQALLDLRKRITVSLRAFNDATPQGSWLKRSEIARMTRDILRTAEHASRRKPASSRPAAKLASWLHRARAALHGVRRQRAKRLSTGGKAG